MKHLISKLSALIMMLMCVSATVQAGIVHHEVCEPTLSYRGFTRECWENTETGQVYADAECTQELRDYALAKAVTYAKLPENPVTATQNFSVTEQDFLDNVIDGVTLNLDFYWSAATTYTTNADNTTRYAQFTVKGNDVSNARIVWFRDNKFTAYGKYTVEISVNGVVKYNRNQNNGEEFEGAFVASLPGLKDGDVVRFAVTKTAQGTWAGGPTFKASLEYTSFSGGAIEHHTPCAPTLTSRGFTRECWEDTETGKIYANAGLTEELMDGELAQAIVYARLPQSPVVALDGFSYMNTQNVSGVTFSNLATYTFPNTNNHIEALHYASFRVTGSDVDYARLLWFRDSPDVGNGRFKVRVFVNDDEIFYRDNGEAHDVIQYEGVFVQSLPGLKKGDVVKFEVEQYNYGYWKESNPTFKACLEYIGTFEDDDTSPIVYHTIDDPSLSKYSVTRECWENKNTGKYYADEACTQEFRDMELAKTVIYTKLPESPIVATSGFNQSEKETDWDVNMNWAGVTTYTSSSTVDNVPRRVEFKASTTNIEQFITNARLVWNKNGGSYENGKYRVKIYVNDVCLYTKTQGYDSWEGVFVLPLPELKKDDIVRFEVTQTEPTLYSYKGEATFKASLEYNIVPCTHEYPAGSVICSICGYVKPHTHTYNPVHECTQCGYTDESSIIMSGDLGDNIKWRLFNDWTLYYYGTGEMEDFNKAHNAWRNEYKNEITKVIIGEGITKIGGGNYPDGYFNYMSNLSEVSLPSTLKEIGWMAFASESRKLTSITLPEGLETIGYEAFSQSYLESVVIPASVTKIAGNAFYNNTVKSITLNGAPTIGSGAFDRNGCEEIYLMSDKEVSAADDAFFDYTINNATLHVNNAVYYWAKTTSPWSSFKTIVPLNDFNIEYTDASGNMQGVYLNPEASNNTFTLTDGCKQLTIKEDIPMQTLTYTCNFSAANTWQALYVPFEMEYSDWADKFDVAAVNNFHEYTNENGETETVELEVRYVKSGKLLPNIPYLIRAKEAGEQTIVLNNVTLKKTEARSISCSSTERRYTFTGTYDAIDGLQTKDYIFVTGGRLCKADNDTDVLKPMRWYLTIENRESMTHTPSPAFAKPMTIQVIGEYEATGIEDIKVVSSPASDRKASEIYSVTGVRFSKPQSGINIVNGKKVSVK